MNLLNALALGPHRHPGGEQGSGHAAKCTVAICTQVPSASSPVSCYSADGQKNCENTTAPEAVRLNRMLLTSWTNVAKLQNSIFDDLPRQLSDGGGVFESMA